MTEREELQARLDELKNEMLNVKGTECEVYSRVVGYFRPVKQWNNGKQEEYADRVAFDSEIRQETTSRAL
jgi:ribonucleoside-triphosphate reductase